MKLLQLLFFEPIILGSAGMKMYEAKYLDKIIATCKVNNILCIADEVMTGFGRTGKHFACDYLEHQPDIFCLSKAITGGFLPLGITSCTINIYNAFLSSDRMKTLFHGHSYTANPIVCAAANASIKLLQENQSTIKMLVDWQSELKNQLKEFSIVSNLRQLGTIVAFEIAQNDDGYFSTVKEQFYKESLKSGVLLRPLGNTIYIFPPYVISKNQLEKVYRTIISILEKI
ncbi:MAG: aminotransferase class III-fold pyridoxal phosphate-dependent enzyme [Chitinophagales bacterium]